MPRGGKRPGAGRKKGYKEKQTISKEIAREQLRQIVLAELKPMTDAQIANAKGIKYLVARERKGGKFVRLDEARVKAILEGADSEHEMIEVWEKDPSTPAFTDLMNRAIDKPTETLQAEVNVNVTEIQARLVKGRLRAHASRS